MPRARSASNSTAGRSWLGALLLAEWLGVVALLIPATIFGLNMGTAVLFQEGSTLLVVINALRLIGFTRRDETHQFPALGKKGSIAGLQGLFFLKKEPSPAESP